MTVTKETQFFASVSLKQLMSEENVQRALKEKVSIPDKIVIKEVRKPFKNPDTGETSQKINCVWGTSVYDIQSFDISLEGCTLDPIETINKTFQIIDFRLSLAANMSGGKFGGYAAKGLKLTVTKLEEVKK